MTNFVKSYNRMKHDSLLVWRPGRIYIPAWQLAGLDYEATGAADIKSAGTGTPSATNLAFGEINTSGITGIQMTTAGNSVNHLMEVPADMDLSQPVYVSVYWTANNTSGSVDWNLAYKVFVPGTTVLGTAEAATAFDVDPAAQTMAGVAYTLMRTPEGRINGRYTIPESTEILQLAIIMNALVTITTVFLVGVAIRYTPRRLWGPDGMQHEAKAPTFIAGKTYAN
jgi:hypothetical protein